MKRFGTGLVFIFFALTLALIIGCASTMNLLVQGGKLVDPGYNPEKILISYRAEGNVPSGISYYLVETDEGLAIWERSDQNDGALYQAYRRTDEGEHFSLWVPGQPGFEVIVPFDRTQPAKRYEYPVGKYEAKRGSMAVVPLSEFEPVAILYPK